MRSTPFNGSLFTMCKMREIPSTVSCILHVFDPALPHFTQTSLGDISLVQRVICLKRIGIEVKVRFSVKFRNLHNSYFGQMTRQVTCDGDTDLPRYTGLALVVTVTVWLDICQSVSRKSTRKVLYIMFFNYSTVRVKVRISVRTAHLTKNAVHMSNCASLSQP